MPHLSPMSWIITTLIFWGALISLISLAWWQQTPKFSHQQTTVPTPPSQKWKW